jgi:hypothetical protein
MSNMGMNPGTGINPYMGMSQNAGMNPWLEMNPNTGMNSCMDMYPHMDMCPHMDMNMDIEMGTNPWMEMREFDEEIFQDSFNSMNRMYEDAQGLYFGDDDKELRKPDKYGDTEPFKCGYNKSNKFNPKYNDVDSIVRRIERYNPEVFRTLNRYRIPYLESKGIVGEVVRLSLMDSEE